MESSEPKAEDQRDDVASARTRETVSESASWQARATRVESAERSRGSLLGDYVILDKLGAGGMGIVYAAYDPHLDRRIALKVLRGGFDDHVETARARLVREGRALAKLSHPNVVAVHDVGRVDDEVYIAMELVQGQTLKQWRKARTRGWQEIVAVFRDVAAGLIAVHEAGLVHRDIKPDNVLIDEHGRARVTDFGLARPDEGSASRGEAPEVNHAPSEGLRVDLTQTGARLGTPAYMARELLEGGPATAFSDQFAYCVALWESLYGKRPFEGDTWISLTVSINRGEIAEPPKRPDGRPVPVWLRKIVERGLAPDPEARWPSMRALADALGAGDPHRRARRLWSLGGIAALVGGGMWGVAALDAAERERAVGACEDEGQSIGQVWSTERSDRITAAFSSSGRPNADQTAREVIADLDAYATRWSELRTEACVDATIEQTLDDSTAARAVSCLQRSRSGFEALLTMFEQADEVVVARAKRSVEGLAELDTCADRRRLLLQPSLPERPAVRAEVQALHEVLARTQVHEHLGRFDEGLSISRDALERALATEHLPVIALARYRVAVFLEKRGEYQDAVEQWVGSFHDALRGGHEQLAAEAATALAFCEGYQLARHDAGIRWAELAGVYVERLELGDTLTEATRLDVLAVLREMKGELARSIETHEQALAIRRALVGEDHHSVGYGLVNLAAVLEQTGELQRAKSMLLQARRIFEHAFGPDNPTTAHVLHNLANLHEKLGEYDEAEPLLHRVLSIWTDTLGPEHPDLGDVQATLADLRTAQGALEQAAEHYQAALRIHQAGLPADHPQVAQSATKLGQALLALQRLEEAQVAFELAVRVLEDAPPEQSDRLGRALHGLGSLALRRVDPVRAQQHFEASIAAFEAHPGEHEDWIARGRVGLAAALALQTEGAESDETLAVVASDPARSVRARTEALAWQARSAASRGDAARARELRDRAMSLSSAEPGLAEELDTLLQF